MSEPELKNNSRRCQCPACGEYFNSAHAFDKHRIGPHGDGRRCRSAEEMLEHGMAKNPAGFWVTERLYSWDGYPGPSWVIDAGEKRQIHNTTEEET